MLNVTRFHDVINAVNFYKAVKAVNGDRVYVQLKPNLKGWKVTVKDNKEAIWK